MSFGIMKTMMVGALMLGATVPAAAQERGTIEFGAFGNYSFYDGELNLEDGWGAGGRVGAFIVPRLSVEFDVGRKWADRPDGLESVEVEAFAWRVTAVPLSMGPLSVLLGAGAIHTDVQTPLREETDGWQGLVGLKLALGSSAALRVEGVMDWNDDDTRNKAVQFGLSLYRHPGREAAPAGTMAPPRTITRVDTIRTVRVDTVRAGPALPTGQASTMCLSTGEAVQVLVTAQNDTLVGASRTSIRVLRQGGAGFAGEYAQGRTWFEQDQSITFDRRSFQKSGDEVRLNCPDIMRVGEYQGVPLFVRRNATTPYQQLYVPVRPGVWQAYESLRGTRG